MNSAPFRPQRDSAVVAAMSCAASVTAQFIAGKATRDALFLAHMDVTALPAMVVLTSVVSIGLVFLSSRTLRRAAPAAVVPLAFVLNAALLLVSWGIVFTSPPAAGIVAYLLISGLGPMLGSGFWLIVTERFDPRTAKQRFGHIAGIGTLSGLAGGLLAERVAAVASVSAMLPVLAAMNLACAWQIRRFAVSRPAYESAHAMDMTPELAAEPASSGFRALARAPYLRNLAALVLLGTIAASLADYLFKAQAVDAFGRGDTLLRFFALYYGATGLLAFAVQTWTSRLTLEKIGLAFTAGTPSLALLGGGLGALIAPGIESMMAARAGESIFRGSLFRSGYELFYTPIPSKERRAAKTFIDVGVDRVGDAVGGGVVRALLFLTPAAQYYGILGAAMVCSAVALVLASRLNRGYIQTLERSLLHRAVEIDLSDIEDMTTRTIVHRTLAGLRTPRPSDAPRRPPKPEGAPRRAAPPAVDAIDAEILQIMALRSRDRDRVLRALDRPDGMAPALVPHVIPLLAWDAVAPDAVTALRKVAEEHVGELTDALIDPNQPFAVRRRLARVFAVCVSQRAADAVLLGLDDLRFEVRYHSGRSLTAIVAKNPRVYVNRERVLDVVRRETAVGQPVWESDRLLNQLEEDDSGMFVDEYVKERASRSLAHVFTLLSLVLPSEPLQIAFRGLHTTDQALRGTALEYLEGVLPPAIRDSLWPFLEDPRPAAARVVRAREEILADLLRSSDSIMVNLADLKRQSGPAMRQRGKPA
jgi:hypothetical protein